MSGCEEDWNFLREIHALGIESFAEGRVHAVPDLGAKEPTSRAAGISCLVERWIPPVE